jgi:hypothetical protein
MVYLNSASRSRNVGSLINQPSGGGDKKAGFPYQIGRDTWTSIYFAERVSFDLNFWRQLPAQYPKGGVTMNLPMGYDKRIRMRGYA